MGSIFPRHDKWADHDVTGNQKLHMRSLFAVVRMQGCDFIPGPEIVHGPPAEQGVLDVNTVFGDDLLLGEEAGQNDENDNREIGPVLRYDRA